MAESWARLSGLRLEALASSCPAALSAQVPLRAKGRACAACPPPSFKPRPFQAAQGCFAYAAGLSYPPCPAPRLIPAPGPCVELAAPWNHIFSTSFLACGVDPLPTPDQRPQGPFQWRSGWRFHSVASGLRRGWSLRPLSASLLGAFDLHPGQSPLPSLPRLQAVGSALEGPLSSMMSSFFLLGDQFRKH